MNGFVKTVFFGNYFYGICTMALSIEASLQQKLPLNSPLYYLFGFVATVLYYTHPYTAATNTTSHNGRIRWYATHRSLVAKSQIVLTFVFIISLLVLGSSFIRQIKQITLLQWSLLLAFPLMAAMYYGHVKPNSAGANLRNNGWLKPFVIGFVWAGIVTIYPGLWISIANQTTYAPGWISSLLFIKNGMFITTLCILFDIKDYAADHNKRLKTFVVRLGLRKTIFFLVIPLSSWGLATFVIYAVLRDFPLARILINTIPFILLITVAWSLRQRKTILYYLAIIDGLMLVKAICGIVSVTLIKY